MPIIFIFTSTHHSPVLIKTQNRSPVSVASRATERGTVVTEQRPVDCKGSQILLTPTFPLHLLRMLVLFMLSVVTASVVTVMDIINPRRACAARVTVVVLCVCMYVCMCVCVCVHSYLPPHILESQKRDTNGFCAIQGSF